MPGKLLNGDAALKRKRPSQGETLARESKPRKAVKPTRPDVQNTAADILEMEQRIVESRKHYNDIVKLHELASKIRSRPKTATLAAVALCRVFCRLIAGENLLVRKEAGEADKEIAVWLRNRLDSYVSELLSWFGSEEASQEGTALTLLMRLAKEETSQGSRKSDLLWRSTKGTFYKVVQGLIATTAAESARAEFVEKYLEEHDDVRFYTFLVVKQLLTDESSRREDYVANAIDLFSRVEGVPDAESQLEDWYGEEPATDNKQLRSLSGHHKVAQGAWLTIFRSDLSYDQRKTILSLLNAQVLPWFTGKVEMLVDFLADSFQEGGVLSLLALSGIFYLMTEKNLDYPDFYNKLYSLLDENLMQSKWRSRFFRLMEKFMNSSHLPAVMVASFIKRLARLSLRAPPGAIVFIIPWTYNMLKQHPACTFMIHRPYHPAHVIFEQNPEYLDLGMDDPFDMSQPDPMLTQAINSSLWELETLQSHYHPNIATLAKIISEQFTKRNYQLEDFLDHSYAALVDAELEKNMKKEPVVEWEIPKHIISTPDSDGKLNPLGQLLQHAIDTI